MLFNAYHSHLFCNDYDDDDDDDDEYDEEKATMSAANVKTVVFMPISCCQIVVCSLDRLCMEPTQD